MWDWLRLRRRAHTNRTVTTHPDRPVLDTNYEMREGINRLLSNHERNYLFTPRPVITCFPPKCIGRQQCSQILYGERLEDFSSDCWLENHLHRFGYPESNETNTDTLNIPFEESNDDSTTASETVSSGFSFDEIDFQNTLNSAQTPNRPRLALEELFIPMNRESHTEPSMEYNQEMPPPYSPFEDPPPSYDEAVGAFNRSFNSTVSSSSSAFMW